MKKLFIFLLSAAIVLSACAPTAAPTAESTLAPGSASPTPELGPPLYMDATQPIEARVEDLLARMTLDEKIGQMTQVEKNSITPGDITKYYIGSILSGGGGSPARNTPAAWYAMVQGYQDEALATRLGIPLIYGVDAVHGHGNLKDATIFPHNIGLGATNDPDLVCRIARATAEEILATGIPWDFAPVVAAVQDIRWGRTYEGFSEDTEIVTRLGEVYVRCMQEARAGMSGSLGALATPKHYIGDGATIWASSRTGDYEIDQGNMQVPEEVLRTLYLPPYVAAVDAGAMNVMASFSSWKGTKMHAQKGLLTDVLKGELGFNGFIVSDWQAIDQIYPDDYYASVVTSINAGVDMNMVPYDYIKFIDVMKSAVNAGDIPQERVDDAVRRILRTKFMLGLFEQPMPDPSFQQTVRSDEHLALAREAVSKSLVLLVNNNQALPISRDARIFVAGEAANNIGLMNGGWTLEWQGVSGNTTEGTSILSALVETVGPNTLVMYDKGGIFDTPPDADGRPLMAEVGIMVVSEKPYAEGVGDNANPTLSPQEIAALSNLRARSEKVVVIILSGRPLIITDQLPLADAWVAAWLPGTEGAGITDVLFGDVPFTGKLAYTWPRSAEQLPLNINNIGDKIGCEGPLFPFGYGLAFGQETPEILDCE